MTQGTEKLSKEYFSALDKHEPRHQLRSFFALRQRHLDLDY